MALAGMRGPVRGSRRAPRFVVTTPKTKASLLKSTALYGGSLAPFGAALAMQRPWWLSASSALAVGMLGGVMVLPAGEALAACAQSPTNTWTCTTSGSVSNGTPQATITPSGNSFAVRIGQPSGTADNYRDTGNFNDSNLAAVVINDSGSYSGTITVTGTSTLKGDKADALRFYTTGTSGTPDITFNVNGTLYGGNDAAGTSGYTLSPGDGLHVGQSAMHAPDNESDGQIGTLVVNVGNSGNSDAVIRGADDGIEIAQNITTLVTVTNYGTINGLGRKGGNTGIADGTNWGEGVHISTVDKGYGSGYQIDGAATLTNNGIIVGHANTGETSGDGAGSGVNISAKGAITITNAVIVPPGPDSDNDGPGSIRGTDGVVAFGDGSSDISLTNTGHIQGDSGNGADLSHAKNLSVENHSLGSLIGTTNGQVLHDAQTASYDNSGGLTAGLGGNGLVIHDINGVTTGELPQYNIVVDNTAASEGESGGIIVGQSSGVSMYGNDYSVNYAPGTNAVLLDNSGEGDGPSAIAGGLIVGMNGNGVEITGTTADVRIDNSYTRNGAENDLSGTTIDSAVGYSGVAHGESLLDQMVSGDSAPFTYGLNYTLANPGAPSAPDNGITTGIWGYGWGVYEENVGGVASVDNTQGQIFGKTGDGIKLSSIGNAIVDRVEHVVTIDNSHGLIEGGYEGGGDGVRISSVEHGGVSMDNTGGATLGGINGVEIDTVDGSVTLHNEEGLVAGFAGAGAILSNIDGAAVLENEGGVTMGLAGNGATISYVGGEGGEGNAVTVLNSEGGVIAGSEGGLEISHVFGDASEGEAASIYVDNSAHSIGEGDYAGGGLIVGLDGAGVSIHDIGPTDSEGEAGTVTIDNRGTRGAVIDFAELGNGGLYSEGDPSTGLLGSFVGSESTAGAGIYGTIGISGVNIAGDVAVLNEDGNIQGTEGGIDLSAIGGDVDIYNGRQSEDAPGGSISAGNFGIQVIGAEGDLSIDNVYGTITTGATSGADLYGIHGQNIAGTVTIDNAHGVVTTQVGDGINLDAIGSGLSSPVEYVVDIDNSSGEIYGNGAGHDGLHVTDVLHGGVWLGNDDGVVFGSHDGVDVDGVAGDIDVSNHGGAVIGIEDHGASLGNVAGVVSYDNEGGLTFGEGDGATISYISGLASEGDAVAVYNGNGGLFAGESGLVISHISGDGSEGEANDIYVDNSAKYLGEGDFSAGGAIVGLNSNGIDVHDVGQPDGESGSVLIDNRRTLHTAVDVAAIGGELLYIEGEGGPSGGLMGPFADIHGEDGIVGSGIYGTIGIAGTDIGGAVTVLNEDGLIIGADTGIELARIGDDIEIDNGRAWRHGDGGSITGGAVGVSVSEGEGGLTIDNSHGTIIATNTTGPSAGIYANQIVGIVDIDNSHGDIGVVSPGGFGITLSSTGAATITNHAGAIASEGDGGYGIQAYGLDSLTIDNGRYGSEGDAGLIYGAKYGVAASYAGDIDIDNQRGAILTVSSGPNANGAGVLLSNITGDVTVKNARGTIFGAADGDTGISAHVVSGHVSIDNGSYQVEPGDLEHYGFIGGAIGVSLADVSEGADIDNSRGVIYGHEQGIIIDQANGEGDIEIQNSGGSIEGYLKNGIQISKAGTVNIYNGETHGGTIFGGINSEGGSAIDVQGFAVAIFNGQSWLNEEGTYDTVQGGLIVGAGTGPVIALATSQGEGGGGYVDNMGIISALGPNPYRYTDDNESGGPETFASYLGDVTLPFAAGLPLDNDTLPSEGGLEAVYDDAADIRDYAVNDDGSIANLDEYASAAAALAIQGENGATWVNNGSSGLLFGRVALDGSTTGDAEGDADYGNAVMNSGIWFTTGMNALTGAGENFITNGGGLIQTALNGSTADMTTFDVANFFNAFSEDSEGSDGVLSLVDGNASDVTTITGNFFGSESGGSGGYGTGQSLVALDVFLDAESGNPAADLLHVEGDAYGTTGIIINNLNNSDVAAGNTAGIKVVAVDGDDAMTCVDVACSYGDTFYISSLSSNYLEINGKGTIQQGMFAWYLTEKDNNPDPDYYLMTAALPTGDQTPELVTAFTNIFYDGTDVVSDHVYGGHFPATRPRPGLGGGGADVPAAADSSQANAAIWGRVSGSWTRQETTVDTSAFGTIDTGFTQDTTTLIGGADMSPFGEGNGVRVGVYGGYTASRVGFDAYGTRANFEGGVMGAYAAYTHDDFYVDSQFNANFLGMTFDAPFGGGEEAHARGVTLGMMANIGNRFRGTYGFFEPLASFAYANTAVADLNSGTANVSFANGESIRAGAGARIGTSYTGGAGNVLELSMLGRVWNEFASDTEVTLTDGSNTDTFVQNTSGVFGEVSGTATFSATGYGFSTYVAGGATFKEDATTWNAKLGLRQSF